MTSKVKQEDQTFPLMKTGNRGQFVIALDFGTTYSGVGWALEAVKRKFFSNGQEEQVRSLEKVPTQFSYHASGIRWGYQVDDSKEVIRGIKLLLDRNKADNYAPAIDSIAILDKEKKNPVDAAADYLRELFSCAQSFLKDVRGYSFLEDAWDVQYVLTVPAVWSDKAKDLTTQAACLAGIPKANLCLLSEPEAAAVYAIQTIQPNSIGINDSFIVCDAGGGTVDLITYRVTQIEPMILEEVSEGTGGMCGSMVLDSRFQKFIIETVGKTNYDRLKEAAKKAISKTWESDIKTRYEGPDTAESGEYSSPGEFIPLPGIPDIPNKNVEDGMLYMENSQIKSIFDPTMKEIESLIADQQEKAVSAGYPPKAVLLVGGLGSSKYLFKRLESLFSDMRIMQPPNAWSAIIRGAVHRGLEGNQVENRKARSHYGVRYATLYDPMVHTGQTPYWDEYKELMMVSNQMRWYIRKGESTSEQQPIKVPFSRTVPLDATFEFHDFLHMCVEEVAPDTYKSGFVDKCELVSDLSKVPKELFHKRKNSKGVEFYDIVFELVLTPLSASFLFELEFNGMSYGMVRASWLS